jgi:hypothetical protein
MHNKHNYLSQTMNKLLAVTIMLGLLLIAPLTHAMDDPCPGEHGCIIIQNKTGEFLKGYVNSVLGGGSSNEFPTGSSIKITLNPNSPVNAETKIYFHKGFNPTQIIQCTLLLDKVYQGPGIPPVFCASGGAEVCHPANQLTSKYAGFLCGVKGKVDQLDPTQHKLHYIFCSDAASCQ